MSQLEGVTCIRVKISAEILFNAKQSTDIALNPQDEASKARLSSLGQFRLTVKQLLPVAEKAVPTSRQLGSCELAFQHLKHKSEEDNGSALRIRRKKPGVR